MKNPRKDTYEHLFEFLREQLKKFITTSSITNLLKLIDVSIS